MARCRYAWAPTSRASDTTGGSSPRCRCEPTATGAPRLITHTPPLLVDEQVSEGARPCVRSGKAQTSGCDATWERTPLEGPASAAYVLISLIRIHGSCREQPTLWGKQSRARPTRSPGERIRAARPPRGTGLDTEGSTSPNWVIRGQRSARQAREDRGRGSPSPRYGLG